jgi:galactose oxidase
MGVLLQGFYKLRPNRAVPSPADGDPKTPWWWDHLAAQANELRAVGFTAIWLPPVLKTSAGVHTGADGYGPFDDYDIGSKSQMGSVPTRFGSREQLQRCVATLRANGLDVYLDMVEHQRSGDPGNFVFRYRGSDGTPATGRFPKDPLNFVPNVPRDPNLGGPAKDDFPFGRELAPINGKPQGYVFNGLIDAADWLTRALDVQGYRLDDVKGLSTDFLFPFLTSKSMAGKFAFGEFFDGNRTLVNGWIFNPHGMRGRASAFDFPLRFILAAMCNNPGRFDMTDLDHAGLAGISPLNAVTFVENHDTDLNEPVVANKILAYAYILTSEGYPCVYYRDYSQDPNCYGLKQPIDNLIWIHEKLAAGPTQQRWRDFDLFAYERLGQPGLLVALNNDPAAPRTIEVATAFGANVVLHDYTGHGPDLVTSGAGTIRLTVPRNTGGTGYVCYSRTGISGGFAATTRTVTHEFEGAAGLDLPPAEAGKTVQPGRVWCAAETPIKAALFMPGLAARAEATVEIAGPDATPVAARTFAGPAAADAVLETTATRAGFHALRLKLGNTSDGAKRSYKLAATYTGAERLPAEAAGVVPATPPISDHKEVGQWEPKFSLPNVAIHTHVLPNGKVLFWGRRDHPNDSLDVHECTPHIWDPITKATTAIPQPTLSNGTKINLFCSGHAFLADGRLLVAGGHIADGDGLNQAALYDYRTNSWSALPIMSKGRWYPTVLALADGTALVSSGSENNVTNEVSEIWDGTDWRSLAVFKPGLSLYPRMHVAPDGQVFMSGWLAQSYFLNLHADGQWTPLAGPGGSRAGGLRDYAPAVMYDAGKVVFIGGGNDKDTHAPTTAAEIIDLTAEIPVWRATGSMHHPRRQHNATILPDGTVLVTGGTQGGGGPNGGFNDLTSGEPVHTAELWNPATGEWTELAAEDVDRCYHSTTVLLPDGTVLSAGGGEYRPDNIHPNDAKDSHRDAQIFRPPYLFREGQRPEITSSPTEVVFGQTFSVGTPLPQDIEMVTWIRLPSVTHAMDYNQRVNFLSFRTTTGVLEITAPGNANICPPGHYMLFLLNKSKVPSIAKILHIGAPAGARGIPAVRAPLAQAQAIPSEARMSTAELDYAIRSRATGTHVAIGLTSRCPYGLGACWGGAYEALQKLDGVQAVRPNANAEDSTAEVFLHGDTLPDVSRWAEQIASVANGSYDFRGVEVSVRASVKAQNGAFGLIGPSIDKPVLLAPLEPIEKVQFDRSTRTAKPAVAEEHSAYERLVARYRDAGAADLPARVTGPLRQTNTGWTLHVRAFEA